MVGCGTIINAILFEQNRISNHSANWSFEIGICFLFIDKYVSKSCPIPPFLSWLSFLPRRRRRRRRIELTENASHCQPSRDTCRFYYVFVVESFDIFNSESISSRRQGRNLLRRNESSNARIITTSVIRSFVVFRLFFILLINPRIINHVRCSSRYSTLAINTKEKCFDARNAGQERERDNEWLHRVNDVSV